MYNIRVNWKRIKTALAGGLCVVSACVFCGIPAAASEIDRSTTVTFNVPVEIPGKVLPAGTYLFRLLDSTSNPNLVEILDKDGKYVYGIFQAIPDFRPHPPAKPMIQMKEQVAGAPEAVDAWFYPGEQYGEHFLYRTSPAAVSKHANPSAVSADEAGQQ